MSSDCLFCQIVAGEIPSAKVYENDDILAFLDIAPITKGHTLVIPKEHYSDLESLPKNKLEGILSVSQEIAKIQKQILSADGVNLLQNNGSAAGQEVFHFHMHVIPRFKQDGHHWGWPSDKYDDSQEMLELANKMKVEI